MAANHTAFPNEQELPIRTRRATAAGAAIVVILLVGAFMFGERVHAATERDQAVAIEEENRAFCTSLGFVAATEIYGRCTDGLVDVRQRQKDEILRLERGII